MTRAGAPGEGEGHADDGALAGGVGGLAHLSVEGRHGGRVHHHAALVVRVRLVLPHQPDGLPDHVEGAAGVHQLHLGGGSERVEVGAAAP